MAIEGFWSYVHTDDEAEGGRIARLARDVVAQYEMFTGETIRLFLDRDDLEWGDEWKAKVDSSLSSIAFFIPILTPRYFLSAECRRELNGFARKASELGLSELLMPILYVDFPGLLSNPPTDELIALVTPYQWEVWTELRFADPASTAYRKAVAALAERLVRANAAAEQVPLPPARPDESDDDEEPGTLERFQRSIEAMGEWTATLTQLGIEIQSIGAILENGAAAANVSGGKNDFAVRIRVLREIAGELTGPVTRMEVLSQEYTKQLYDVDSGVRLAIEQAPNEVASDQMSLEDACEFFTTIRDFTGISDDALGSTQGLVDSIAGVEKLSRDIRPVLRTLRRALTGMIEGRAITQGWLQQMDESGLNCPSLGKTN